jgi:uncharacterized membrane protein
MNEPMLPAPRKRGVLARLRASFLTGLVVVLPVGLTLYIAWAFIGWIDGWILPLIPAAYQPEALLERMFGPDVNFPVRGLGVIVFLIFTIIIGWIAKGLIGRSVINWAEGLLDRTPVVRSVYSGVKQVTETFFGTKEKSFDKTCLVEFPRKGAWALGFVASKPKGEIAERLPGGEDYVGVFVALTPFTSGALIFVPARDVIMLDMSTEDTAKMVVSAGLVTPPPKVIEA